MKMKMNNALRNYQIDELTNYFLGLLAVVFRLSCSTGYTLLLRHRCFAQKLQRGIRFYPAASVLLKEYLQVYIATQSFY